MVQIKGIQAVFPISSTLFATHLKLNLIQVRVQAVLLVGITVSHIYDTKIGHWWNREYALERSS